MTKEDIKQLNEIFTSLYNNDKTLEGAIEGLAEEIIALKKDIKILKRKVRNLG